MGLASNATGGRPAAMRASTSSWASRAGARLEAFSIGCETSPALGMRGRYLDGRTREIVYAEAPDALVNAIVELRDHSITAT